MADEKEQVVDLYKTVKMYAPTGAKHHTFNQEITVSALLQERFESKGFSTKKFPKEADTGKA